MSWTEERIERLKKMWAQGATASQIADELGGVSRIIAGAVLPMTPPPRLSMSPSREALNPYLDQLDRTYTHIQRPPGPIPTW